MYRLRELGDCFLITFAAGAGTSRMLVDCGSFRNSRSSAARLAEIAGDIRRQLAGSPLDVVVGTHQHNDHLSGFVHCAPEFRSIGIDQVWLSWLDDPRDRKARGIGEMHNNLKLALFNARSGLRGLRAARDGLRPIEILDDMLGFYGAKGAKTPPVLPANAVEILKRAGKQPPRYLRPGEVIDMPGLPSGHVRIYVLGPPRDDDLLYRKDPRSGESYDHALASAHMSAARLLEAVATHKGKSSPEERQYPFSENFKRRGTKAGSKALRTLTARYRRRESGWRKIDDDWLGQAEALSLYLDSFTNNSSVVLAIELVASGKILLFAADAQTGNWLSWPKVKWQIPGVQTDDLLSRTILYKVGHHGSHNATLIDALEKMNHPDLMALIPVHKKDPNIQKKNGWKMPARNLLRRLRQKTSNRVLQMDGLHAPDCDPKREPARTAWKNAGVQPHVTPLFIELKIVDQV
jgi:glyoxylase-like metal-dependent hydrolase (beta-lactamase superfamily II)